MKTKIIFSFLTILAFVSYVEIYGQTPNWQWAKSAGSGGNDKGNSLAVDAAGNVYATGWYTSGSITFGNYTLINKSTSDFFIVKYDAAGNVRWAKNQGGTGGDVGYAIALDNKGNIYLTGWFSSPKIGFGTDTLINSGVGNSDIFIAKYDTAGNVLWAKRAGGNAGDVANSITTDANGDVYVTGSFTSATGDFGGFTLTNSGAPSNDIFIIKYDAAGIAQWAKSAGGALSDEGNGICADNSGNIFVTGYLGSTSSTFGSIPITGAGGNDIFIAKYNASNGNELLAKSIGGSNNEEGYGIATSNGNIYITGKFSSAALNFVQSSAITNASTGTADVFIAQHDVSLTALWAKSFGGAYDDAGYGITTDGNGNAYATGMFMSPTIAFGGTVLNNTSSGSTNIWVAAFDGFNNSSGNSYWAVTASGNYEDHGKSVAVDATNNYYIAGMFNSTSLIFNTNTVYKGCGDDFFIAKLSQAVGISEQNSEKEIASISPNPNEGKFNLQYTSDESVISIEIYNTIGERIFNKSISSLSNSKTVSIDLSQSPKGIYLYKLITEKGNERSVASGKFVTY